MLTFGVVLMLACALIYYTIGDREYRSGFPLAVLSVGLWILVEWLLGWGWGAALVGQAALFVALTVWNMKRADRRKGSA